MPSEGTKLTLLGLAVTFQVLLVRGAPHLRADDFSLVLLHNNDMHGRFEETERNSGTCQEGNRNNTCIGGMARTAHVVRSFREQEDQGGPPVLFLNAGDTFVGTAWFSVFTWNISAAFMNVLKPDAISLGNHEFDFTEATLSPFIDAISAPVLAANMNFSQEPSLEGKIQPSLILDVGGRKVGIIGYLTPDTAVISSVGKVTFEDEVSALRRESEALASEGVDIIIALGHSGYLMDRTIASEVELVDVVIGGHTNTFLWNGDQPDLELIDGPYPTVVTQKSGKQVPVVQAYAYTKYLGVLNCTFDSNGNLTSFSGQPILMETTIPQEEDVLDLLEIYRPAIDTLNEEVVGISKVTLLGDWECRIKECNLGNLITDAFVFYALTESTQKWTNTPIAICNGGSIRTTVTPVAGTGNITRGELLAVLPFSNQLVQITLKGSDLLLALEQMVRSNGETSQGEFPQISGLKLILDMSQPSYSRVVSVKARCGVCEIPMYETVDPEKNYTLVTSSFLSEGGDNITVFSERALEKNVLDLGDLDVVVEYFERYSPVYPEEQGRIKFVEESSDEDEDVTPGDEDGEEDDGDPDHDHDSDDDNAGNAVIISWQLLFLALLSSSAIHSIVL
ncbi:protein 5NUC-like [Euwallacea similis]|uniref:protein 5NUC-like n=1 Tax=Euwallacea similis TaxID=1736056 RepID=UPI00344DFE40